MSDIDKRWEKLSNWFYNDVLVKYNIDLNNVSDRNLEAGLLIIDIQARFDGERLFHLESDELEDLKFQINYLEQLLEQIEEINKTTFFKDLYDQ